MSLSTHFFKNFQKNLKKQLLLRHKYGIIIVQLIVFKMFLCRNKLNVSCEKQ